MAESDVPLDWPGADEEWAASEQRRKHPTPDEAHEIGWSKGHIQGFREGRVDALREAARRYREGGITVAAETGVEFWLESLARETDVR